MIEPEEIIVRLYGENVGKIALSPQGFAVFQYDSEYLSQGFSISPFKLPLRDEVFIATATPFRGNFGVFDDSLPDGWGRLLQDRDLQAKGINPFELSVLQRLAIIGKNGRGALEYEPVDDTLLSQNVDDSDLERFAKNSERVLDDQEIPAQDWRELIKGGGSSGGARPKVFVKSAGKEWLVKFASQIDPGNIGAIEYQYAQLARACGIEMPEVRLFDGKYFGTQRFDRTHLENGAVKKVHVVSSAGLLNADYRIPSLDYKDLLTLTKVLTRDMSQVEQFFRRMLFNVLIGNRDDHAKNFAFMMSESSEWRLTPAYDLLPSEGFNGYHTTTVNGNGKPQKEDCFKLGVEVGLTDSFVHKCYEEMREVLESVKRAK